MHATTIHSVIPGPDFYKTTASDYCSSLRQKSDDSNSTGSMAFKHVKVYGVGRSLFRCISTHYYVPEIKEGCFLDPRLKNFETTLADTVQTMEANLTF